MREQRILKYLEDDVLPHKSKIGTEMSPLWWNVIRGAGIGGLIGLALDVTSLTWISGDPLLFVGEWTVLGAIAGGVLGVLFGEPFFEWIADHWRWFLGG